MHPFSSSIKTFLAFRRSFMTLSLLRMSFTTKTTHALSSGVLNIPSRGFVEYVLGGGHGVDAFRSSGGGSTACGSFERADGDVRGGVSGGVGAASSSDEIRDGKP